MKPDNVFVPDKIDAGLSAPTSPRHPCPACGKETKAHHEPGHRICSDKRCRVLTKV